MMCRYSGLIRKPVKCERHVYSAHLQATDIGSRLCFETREIDRTSHDLASNNAGVLCIQSALFTKSGVTVSTKRPRASLRPLGY